MILKIEILRGVVISVCSPGSGLPSTAVVRRGSPLPAEISAVVWKSRVSLVKSRVSHILRYVKTGEPQEVAVPVDSPGPGRLTAAVRSWGSPIPMEI